MHDDAGPGVPLDPVPGLTRMRSRRVLETGEMMVGEWSLTAAAWTDRHHHEEINYVLEGELHVTVDDTTTIVMAGSAISVRAGALARYAAPEHARMLFVYGPPTDGHQAHDTRYEELDGDA